MRIKKIIFISKASHLASLSNGGLAQLENVLFFRQSSEHPIKVPNKLTSWMKRGEINNELKISTLSMLSDSSLSSSSLSLQNTTQ